MKLCKASVYFITNNLKFERGYVKMFEQYPDLITVEQLQKMLNVGRNTAYKLLKNKTIKSIRIGKVHKIPKTNIIEYLQKNF